MALKKHSKFRKNIVLYPCEELEKYIFLIDAKICDNGFSQLLI